MSEEQREGKEEKDFSEKYVRSLREEAASWRVKCRDMETKMSLNSIKSELNKRGIKADPSWIKVNEGQTVDTAIEVLLKDYPHLAVESEGNETQELDPLSEIINKKVEVGKMPKPSKPDPKSYGHESKAPNQSLKHRQINEIKEDPKARALLREQYRTMLSTEGHRSQTYE